MEIILFWVVIIFFIILREEKKIILNFLQKKIKGYSIVIIILGVLLTTFLIVTVRFFYLNSKLTVEFVSDELTKNFNGAINKYLIVESDSFIIKTSNYKNGIKNGLETNYKNIINSSFNYDLLKRESYNYFDFKSNWDSNKFIKEELNYYNGKLNGLMMSNIEHVNHKDFKFTDRNLLDLDSIITEINIFQGVPFWSNFKIVEYEDNRLNGHYYAFSKYFPIHKLDLNTRSSIVQILKLLEDLNYDVLHSVEFKNGLKNSIEKKYYDNGNLIYEGQYIMGIKEGIHNYYYPNKSLYLTENYSNGKRNGKFIKYNVFGKIDLELIYKNDLLMSIDSSNSY